MKLEADGSAEETGLSWNRNEIALLAGFHGQQPKTVKWNFLASSIPLQDKMPPTVC